MNGWGWNNRKKRCKQAFETKAIWCGNSIQQIVGKTKNAYLHQAACFYKRWVLYSLSLSFDL
jgi:hypothetical protein